MKQIAKGHRGIVYLCKFKGKIAIKKVERKNTQSINRIQNEIFWLTRLSKYSLGPKLYFFKGNYFICEYISGKRIIPYIKESKKPLKVIIELLRQCRLLDRLKIDKKEMTNPYKHIIVRKNKPVMIDFERAKYSEKPKNVTSFFSFLTSGKILYLLNKKGIKINTIQLRPLLINYKKSYSDESFNELIKLIIEKVF